jgi:hypothetical protein
VRRDRRVPHRLAVEQRVEVVHRGARDAGVDGVRRGALAVVHLDGRDALVEQRAYFSCTHSTAAGLEKSMTPASWP